MAICKVISKPKLKICLGDFDKRISIESRTQTTDSLTVDNDEVFTVIATPWARITTRTKEILFDDVNTDAVSTHLFEIRYSSMYEITAENFILFKNKRYRIIAVDNVDEEDEYIRMDAVLLGPVAKEANKA